MIEKSKKNNKKGIISEEDMSTLLQRYTANTVLALLKEVARFEGVKINWNALVNKTTTGISNAREYQMLWRHLAYRHALLDNLEDGAQPLDDDSDLEYELEAFPDVGAEALTEAAACVKVLIASGLTSDTNNPNSTTVEAPLTINIPHGQPVRASSESLRTAVRGMNITIPVSVQKQPVPGVPSAEVLDANGSVNGTIPARRKRKQWTEEEDLELIAAVQKYGEGNWANILRSENKWGRTAPQLSQVLLAIFFALLVFSKYDRNTIVWSKQRWATIRKRRGNSNLGGNTTSGVQLSEAQRAARHAMHLALNPPVKNTFTNHSGEPSSSQHQSQRPFVASSSIGPLSATAKSQITVKKPVKPDLSSDMVRAAAVAAGARIATQSDAASLLKVAHAKNVVHIMPTGGSSTKSIMLAGGVSSHSEAHPNLHPKELAAPSFPTLATAPLPVLQKASSPATQHIQSTFGAPLKMSSELANTSLKQGAGTDKGVNILSDDVRKEQVQEHGASVSANEPSQQAEEKKTGLPNQDTGLKTEAAVMQSSNVPQKLDVAQSDLVDALVNQVEGSQNSNGDKSTSLLVERHISQSAVQENGDKHVDPMEIDKCSEKLEAM